MIIIFSLEATPYIDCAKFFDTQNKILSRYMHGRGCSKRHTVGCTDDLSQTRASGAEGGLDQQSSTHSPGPQSSGGRTRRTGLLTVMERPPGKTVMHFSNVAS